MATSDLQVLRSLVEAAAARNENACAKVLKAFASVLIPQGRSRIYEAGSEVNTRRGRCDLVVLADEYLADQESKRVAYVWELKAPQCCTFILDGKNRARPSDDLYSAENQLIHYLKSLRSDREWQTEHGILAEQDIKFGGIVIGRSASLVTPEDGRRGVRLARRAKEIRDEFFYAGRILLWTGTTFCGRSSTWRIRARP